jgi:uncharacterized membrane protein YhaH (DUF805 family)
MALVGCEDCGTQVSTLAPACPKCGRPRAPGEENTLARQEDRKGGAVVYDPRQKPPEKREAWLALKGRVSRGMFWLRYALPAFVIFGVSIDWSVFVSRARVEAGPVPLPNITLGMLILFAFGILFVGAVKRLHDLGHSGKWMGRLLVVGIAILVVGAWAPPSLFFINLLSLLLVVALALGVYIGFWPGQKGPNGFGPDPLHL